MLTLRAADLRFDAELHEYRLPTGHRIPSVTQILHATGCATDFEAIAATSARAALQIDHRRRLGTAVHADCHAFDDNDLDWNAVHPDVVPYLRAWAAYRENMRLHPLARERRVLHGAEIYCGTLDGIFRNLDTGRRVLVDIKLGEPHHAGAHLQTAAYLAAYEWENGPAARDPIDRCAVQLVPERRVPYVITPYSDWRDTQRWLAVLTTYYEQPLQRAMGRIGGRL